MQQGSARCASIGSLLWGLPISHFYWGALVRAHCLCSGDAPQKQVYLESPCGLLKALPSGSAHPKTAAPPSRSPQDPKHVHDTGIPPTPHRQTPAPRALSQLIPKAAPSLQDAACSGPSPGPTAPQSLRVGVPLPGAVGDVAGSRGMRGRAPEVPKPPRFGVWGL